MSVYYYSTEIAEDLFPAYKSVPYVLYVIFLLYLFWYGNNDRFTLTCIMCIASN
jgi:hypothetical protein